MQYAPTIFGGNTGRTYEDLQRQRRLADSLQGNLFSETPRNVGEGLTAIGKALAYRKADRDATEMHDNLMASSNAKWDALMNSLNGRGAAPMPGGQGQSLYNFQRTEAEEIGSDAMAALGLVDPAERDILARTLMAEAGGEGFDGMLAAGSVVANRVNEPGYGNSFHDVIMAPGQFSAWNGVTGYAGGEQGQNMAAIQPNDAAYSAADAILSGGHDDPTGGATHYYNPDVSTPDWGMQAGGEWDRIGNHVFGNADGPRGGAVGGGRQSRMPALLQLAADPMIRQDPAKMATLQHLIQQEQATDERARQAADPLYQEELLAAQLANEEASLSNAAMRNPTPEPLSGPGRLQADIDAGLVPADTPLQPPSVTINGDSDLGDPPRGMVWAIGPDGDVLREQRDLGGGRFAMVPVALPISNTDAAVEADDRMAESIDAAEESTKTLNVIDSILNNPALPSVTGKYQGGLDPEGFERFFMSQDAIDVAVMIKQLKGRAFLQAFETLKGGGQITEREGQAAEAAMARLQRVQSTEAFVEGLKELRTIADIARRRAMGEDVPEYSFASQPAAAAAMPEFLSDQDAELWPYYTDEERETILGAYK